MAAIGGIENGLALFETACGLVVVDHSRGHNPQSSSAVIGRTSSASFVLRFHRLVYYLIPRENSSRVK